MAKFKVGDKVRAISTKYVITYKARNWEGEVIKVNDSYFRAKTTDCILKDEIGEVYRKLDYKYFELVKPVIKDPVLRVDELITDLKKNHKDAFDEVNFNYYIEAKKPILDDAEKRYLSAVIKPFRNRVERIYKTSIDRDKEYICIELDNNDTSLLPNFKENTMYKGMKVGKGYTLEELGL